jgi:hypothetical protein
VVDDLGLSAESIARSKTAAQNSSNSSFHQMIWLQSFAPVEQSRPSQFTNDRRLIDRALSQVKWNICSRVGVTVLPAVSPILGAASQQMPGNCGVMSANSVVSTLRALRFIVDAMSEIPGRKSMVVFSDSVPREEQDFTVGLSRIQNQPARQVQFSKTAGTLGLN